MPSLQLVASTPLSGKSTIASAVARALNGLGHRVRLERLGSGEAAEADAATFSEYLFVAAAGIPLPQPPAASADEVLILELDAGAAPVSGVPALICLRGAPSEEDKTLAATLGSSLIGSIAVAVDPTAIEAVAREMTNGNLRPLALLPEDLVLAAPSVGEISDALKARLLYDGDNATEVVEDVIIAPVFADPARPHFGRFAHKAILAPFNKTDLHLAAIETQAACLVITGGQDPSPYVIDRAQHDETTVILAPGDTPATVAALAGVWSTSRFRGENKANAAASLLAAHLDAGSLLAKLTA